MDKFEINAVEFRQILKEQEEASNELEVLKNQEKEINLKLKKEKLKSLQLKNLQVAKKRKEKEIKQTDISLIISFIISSITLIALFTILVLIIVKY